MNAQRYPEDYNGIAALAPAINWGQFFPVMEWAHQVVHEIGYYPQPCEILAYTAAAVEACDGADGLIDGVISSTKTCDFNPFSLVGQTFDCDGSDAKFTEGGAKIVQATWQGTRSANGEFLWYGFPPDTTLQTAITTCSSSGDCTAPPFTLPEQWLTLWIAADPNFDLTKVTRDDYERLIKEGIQRYDSIIGTRDADLSRFRESGGKMITWHGIADQLIPYMGSVDYYERVKANDPGVDDYFRLFLAPGTAHCNHGAGPFPGNILPDLARWVEHGEAPERLVVQNVSAIDPATGRLVKGDPAKLGRPLCLYPLVQRYLGGDSNLQASFDCVKE